MNSTNTEVSPVALSVVNVGKSFGGVVALAGVSITANAGSVHSIVGSNGAGKSTLLNIITGQTTPDTGHITVGGADMSSRPGWRRARAGFGRSFQVCRLFDELSVEDNLYIAHALATRRSPCRSWRGSCRASRARIDEVLRSTGLEALRGAKTATLSQGDRKRVEIAIAVVMESRVLLLDEPLAGVSKSHVGGIVDLVLEQAHTAGVAVIFVEHDVDIVLSISDVISVMDRGRVVSSGTPHEIENDPIVRSIYFSTRRKAAG